MCFRNCWYAAIFESAMLTIRSSKQVKLSRFKLNSSVKQLFRGESSLENQNAGRHVNWKCRKPEIRKAGSIGNRKVRKHKRSYQVCCHLRAEKEYLYVHTLWQRLAAGSKTANEYPKLFDKIFITVRQ